LSGLERRCRVVIGGIIANYLTMPERFRLGGFDLAVSTWRAAPLMDNTWMRESAADASRTIQVEGQPCQQCCSDRGEWIARKAEFGIAAELHCRPSTRGGLVRRPLIQRVRFVTALVNRLLSIAVTNFRVAAHASKEMPDPCGFLHLVTSPNN
jgi:hypothetical protein